MFSAQWVRSKEGLENFQEETQDLWNERQREEKERRNGSQWGQSRPTNPQRKREGPSGMTKFLARRRGLEESRQAGGLEDALLEVFTEGYVVINCHLKQCGAVEIMGA